ncbi:ABC-three component system protein [Seonamhaeicola marinus]|uniref:Trypsin-like peptidase domain-containing protein n=1 Tax=Seonamhaeicola marinus TaxID=1912246 RepID=A0A5D0HYQ5_9FLAO|nr:ABC-three component system protein [Seonamhaeicola marinus]TYA74622.1 trypsin-like peptidase domain-containing protein [Seonamhaeicola marinus]
MSANTLKKHTAKVGSGSGCVFQPMDDKSTYILTAKHLFQSRNEETDELEYINDGTEVPITLLEFDGNSWNANTQNLTIMFEENFFPHPTADAAILKIDYLEGFDNIHIRNKRIKNEYYLCGFPSRLSNQDTIGNRVATFVVARIKQSGDFFDVAELSNNIISIDEIEGCSGGGIMAFDDKSNVFVTGIQSRMATNVDIALGEIGFVPVKYFEEIIEVYKDEGKLVELLPVFLKSFVSLIGDTFQFASAGISREEAALSELLTAKAQFIQQSDLTPLAFRSFLGEQRLLIKDQDNVELKRKKVWTFWLELLVILNIVKDKVHNVEDLEDILNRIRFFYSNTDKDFLTTHLQDLWKLDYKDLEDEGLVIFASNQIYQRPGTEGVLDLSEIISDISTARRAFTKVQNQAIASGTIDIAEARDFPFDCFKYASLTTFKEYAAQELDKGFVDMKPTDCYPLLKELYEKLLP